MYLVPEPKELKLTGNNFSMYNKDIVIDKKCSNNIFIAAKELKNILKENCIGEFRIKKLMNKEESCIYLTFDEENSQGYSLIITQKDIVIKGKSEQGLFFGIQTLKQIVIQEGGNVPTLEITDEPDIKDRGYYLDLARGRVPKLKGIKKFIDKLAFYKYTSFQLYIEHSFAWEGMEETYVNKGFLTDEEILEIDQYCKERYIELVPSFASFGHLYNLLQSKSFNKYSELENYQPKVHRWQESREHHTIDASNPESAKLIIGMLERVLPLFSSNKFNICCDETVDMGKGRGKKRADEIGAGRMYVDYLNILCDYLKSQGKEVMFWSDVIRDFTELSDLLPKDIICLVWEYNYPMRSEKFEAVMKTSMRKYICPWTAGAVQAIPQYHGKGYVAYENIEETAKFAKDNNAEGYLVTDWGDYGHLCHAELRFPCLAYGGALSWNASGNSDVGEFDAFISKIEYDNEKALKILKEISGLDSFSFNELVAEYNKRSAGVELGEAKAESEREATQKDLDDYNRICELEEEFGKLKLNDSKYALINAIKAQKNIVAIKCIKKYNIMDRQALACSIEKWCDEFADVWRVDNKESEVDEMINFFKSQCEKIRTEG